MAFGPWEIFCSGSLFLPGRAIIIMNCIRIGTDTDSEICAEVSSDGKLNAKDSTLILQFSVGLRDHFPAVS